jgi:signal transduction histidine kinase
MYNTGKTQIEATIMMTIKNADHVELFMRVDSVSAMQDRERQHIITGSDAQENSVSYTISFKRGESSDTIVADYDKEIIKDSVKIKEVERLQKSIRDERIKMGEGYQSIEMMVAQAQKGLHSAVDEVIGGINFQKFDSILNDGLQNANLDIRYYAQIVDLENDSIIVSNMPENAEVLHFSRFQHVYDIHNERAYVVYAEPVKSIVIRQMAGILSSSFIILVILGFLFWFLMRTIMRQKTLDEMKSNFTSNITHELKTPIAVAYAANDALLNFNQVEDKVKREKYLSISQEQLQKLGGLVEQILSMSTERRKSLRLNMEKVHVNPLIHSIVEQHKIKAEKAIEICTIYENGDLYINTDRIHFSNIISNLIDNAIKYSPEKVSVTVSCYLKNGKLEISVADKGIGISVDKQKYIYDKFYRIPNGNLHDVKGYGLGLFYVKTTTEKLGGSIFVESEPGKGSTFRLLI